MVLCRAAELDILVTDLERANQRAAAAEKETEKLQHMASDTRSATEQDKVKLSRANWRSILPDWRSCPNHGIDIWSQNSY